MAESDSIDAESGFEDTENPTESKEQVVVKFVLRFADKVCSEARMNENHITSVNQMIKGAVPMHMEQLETVAAQSSKLPAILKPKIVIPPLLPKEDLLTPSGLRCYLISDGRDHQLSLLPAEGALFLTNYRIIFRGWPKNLYGSETAITRFFPISSLTKEKKFAINGYLVEIEQQVKEGLQLRSNTAQLIKIAFDDEVHVEDIENFRRSLNQMRFPEQIFHVFAFKGGSEIPLSGKVKKKSSAKHKTIRGFANKTMKTVTRAANFGDGVVSKSTGVMRSSLKMMAHMETIGETSYNPNASSSSSEPRTHGLFTLSSSKNTIEQYKKSSYYKDWLRLGLLPSNDGHNTLGVKNHHNHLVKSTKINQMYSVVPSYPALFLVPGSMGDEHLKRYGRFHKQGRVPVITWKHHKNSSLLLRGSSFQGRGVIGMIKRHHDGQALPTPMAETQSAVEADIFFNALNRTCQMLSSAVGAKG